MPRLTLARFGMALAAALTGGSVGACFSDRPSTGPEPVTPGTAVSIDNFAFAPVQLGVGAGIAVTWTNNDDVAHTVSSDDGTNFDSGVLAPGATFQVTLNQPGTYTYACHLHPFMKAKLIVTP
jgi:plastocyanin